MQIILSNNSGGQWNAYLLKATEVDLLPELEIQAEIPPVLTHQWGTQTALLYGQVREHLQKRKTNTQHVISGGFQLRF